MQSIILKILNSPSFCEVLDVNKDYETEYKNICKKIHPDVCNEKGASEAFKKLQELKNIYEKGVSFVGDAGEFSVIQNCVKFNGDAHWEEKSLVNLEKVYKKANDNFKKYLLDPRSRNKVFPLGGRHVPLIDLQLPEEHVRWILNRLLEFSAYCERQGVVHGGLTPESVLIDPKNHGIKIISFYHTQNEGEKMESISGKYEHWYPESVFTKKKAVHLTDVEMSKRLAIYLLGDKSGSGIKFKNTKLELFTDFS